MIIASWKFREADFKNWSFLTPVKGFCPATNIAAAGQHHLHLPKTNAFKFKLKIKTVMTKVLLIEKSSICYKAIACLLGDFPREFQLYQIRSIDEIQHLPDNFNPEVLLYGGSDIPDRKKWAEISTLRNSFQAVPIIVYNEGIEYKSIVRHFREGIMGYIVKDEEVDELVNSIRKVLQSQKFLSPTALWAVIHKTDSQLVNKIASLTARELQIASYVGSGMRTAQIAKHLGLHYSTVSNFKTQIYQKLKVTNSLDLADELKRNQIL